MRTIVDINCKDKKCFEDKLKIAKTFLPKNSPIHIDVSDGKFSKTKSFVDFKLIKKYSGYFKFQAHLMVSRKNALNNKWFKSPFSMLLFHQEVVSDWSKLVLKAKQNKKQIGAVVDFSDNPKLIVIPKSIKWIMVLAVKPGPSGQKFNKKAINLIKFLRKRYPRATISIDGGVIPQVVKKVKGLGVRVVVSSSYIWNAKNSKESYKKLSSI
ncbi:MAG: hypothetical protein WC705_01140 [Candidatus Paceibacterota bacterium]|jgi:pentose-5-phosphate-3-epimerase